MTLNYLQLSSTEQQQWLTNAERQLGMSAAIIEKDIWVCWLLEQLFLIPLKMAFKGGTSLSKVFNLIQRFSEDVDITIDYGNFKKDLNLETTSRSQLKKISEQLKKELPNISSSVILPLLKEKASSLLPNHKIDMALSDNGERLEFYYPTALAEKCDYMRDHVLLEFGIRNSTEPFEQHTISPLIAECSDTNEITFPTATINVLSPIRTFWEKATLMHVECHRNRLDKIPDRLSRHWYDLAKLADSQVGKEALINKAILISVLEHKKAFFNASYAHYDDCLAGKFLLLPNADNLEKLCKDYVQMQQAGFFSVEPPSFDEVVKILSTLEIQINTIK
jgi:hypothetical protein